MEEPSDTDRTLGQPSSTTYGDDLKPGAPLLDGHYMISGFLNAGGFGITYLGRDNVDRVVVVKECFPNAVCQRVRSAVRPRSKKYTEALKTFVQSFIAEARALAKLKHPNIVAVHQVFEDNGTAYMVMDFIDGRDLGKILATHEEPFRPDEVVSLLRQLLTAVELIHRMGILHRDIAPDNILIDGSGKPVLIDFGEASQDLTPNSRIVTERHVVKEGYSPQELYIKGAEQTAASDLYALAATFHHVISGKKPPSSQRRLAALAMGEADPCPQLADRFPGYPPGFLAAVDAGMKVFPKDRLQSVAEWVNRLDTAQTGKAIGMAAPAVPGAAGSGLQITARSKAAILVGAAVVLAVAATGLWALLG